jgi:hypothetical protein
VKQFTHVSGHPRISNKRQKNGLQKDVLKLWFQICDTMTYMSKKVLLEKKYQKYIFKKTMKPSTIFGGFF